MRADVVLHWAAEQGVSLSAGQTEQLALFQERLLAVNAHMNLTAITDDADIAVKHFIDSLTVLPWLKPGARIVDIGSGAGFPGLPVKIARPDIYMTLVDSLRKRVLFLQETADKLGLTDITCIHARAEELARKPEHRAAYDICTARAVARLSVLAGYALPFVKKGGLFLAMKGPEVEAEAEEAKREIEKRGGRLLEIRPVRIAPDITHTVVAVEKVRV